jgi:murein DD-endopeptidase MepM/ murein hydrolase activator NlpD
MRLHVQFGGSRVVGRLAAVALLGPLMGACVSSDRFAGNALGNPFKNDPQLTGSLPPGGVGGGKIQRQSLAPPQGAANAPQYNKPMMSVGGQEPVVGRAEGWSANGGTAVIVGKADTLNNLSNRYGVPASALLATNGLRSAADIKPGNRIIIPVYSAAGGKVAQAPARVASDAGQPKFRLVQGQQPASRRDDVRDARGRTQEPTKGLARDKAAEKQVAKLGQRPGAKADMRSDVRSDRADMKAEARAERQSSKPVQAPTKLAKAEEPQETASLSQQEKSENVSFRWPAHGRVIAGFGAKGGNEGINIAVPEGTPVKAAEGGIVAYAGSELKGYGNLVLVRHDNGWVSAYANNGEILVKRGEKVKRGQSIAKSGQTGNVSSPQLHFELRKGATPVDPMPHLGGN